MYLALMTGMISHLPVEPRLELPAVQQLLVELQQLVCRVQQRP
jgi:hypothetical protein